MGVNPKIGDFTPKMDGENNGDRFLSGQFRPIFRCFAVSFRECNVFLRFISVCDMKEKLVDGFNPFEKYESKWESSPGRDENKKYLKPPPSFSSPSLNFIFPTKYVIPKSSKG